LPYNLEPGYGIAPPSAKQISSIIPYVLGGISERTGENNRQAQYDKKIERCLIQPQHFLEIRLNSESRFFSQVEVDRTGHHLDRFELFFPEKDNSFLEKRRSYLPQFWYATYVLSFPEE